MNADIITDASFPHGTPQGYSLGCHGTRCPAELSCHVVGIRYRGDWEFKKQIDAGLTLEQIVTLEREQAERAARARPGTRAKASTGDRRAAANRSRADNLALIPRDTLRQLLDEGLTDAQIGQRLGYTRRQVTGTRAKTGWAHNPDRNRRPSTPAPATTGASSLEGS